MTKDIFLVHGVIWIMINKNKLYFFKKCTLFIYPTIIRIIKSLPFHIQFITPSLYYFLNKIFIWIKCLLQFLLVVASSNRMSLRILKLVCNWIRWIPPCYGKYFRCPIWRIPLFRKMFILGYSDFVASLVSWLLYFHRL